VKPLKAPEGAPHDLGQYYLLIDPETSGAFYDRMAQVSQAVALDEGARMPGQGKAAKDPVDVPDAVWNLVTGLAG
jgi:(2R)-3-sulfolactate dehydrogenase (NADP+)